MHQSQIETIQIPGCLVIETAAYATIEAECRAAGELETGGLLVGRRVWFEAKPFIVVVHATGPGQQAVHHPVSFSPDTHFIQQELDRICDDYTIRLGLQVGYVGEWHKHPLGFPTLSGSDIKQAQAILDDPDYGLKWAELVLPVAQLEKKRVSLQPFYLSKLQTSPLAMELLVWERAGLEELLKEVAGPD
jgi:integrative and conjugative element protein (TIGR02256 family)